jgi:hypothetical protein
MSGDEVKKPAVRLIVDERLREKRVDGWPQWIAPD